MSEWATLRDMRTERSELMSPRSKLARLRIKVHNLVHRNSAEAAALPQVVGPCMRFGGYDLDTHVASFTVLVVLGGEDKTPPTLTCSDPKVESETQTVTGVAIDEFLGFTFWRFSISVSALDTQRSMEYTVSCRPGKKFRFYVAAVGQKWTWGFYSCNGFHEEKAEKKYGGIRKLWKDVLQNHTPQKPLHVMVGGGDQLYNDNVFELSTMKKWLKIKDLPERLAMPFSAEMDEEVAWKYFSNYMTHWSELMFAGTMATVPQVMMWDDHDIFDGWGSYKPEIQECAVFKGTFTYASRFYCLFQQHSTPAKMFEENGVFGEAGWNWIGYLGPTTAVLMLDARTERTRAQVIRPKTWEMVRTQLQALPPTVRHLVVVATVPVIYPKVAALDGFVKFMSAQGVCQGCISWCMYKCGLGDGFFGMFGEPEILDDLIDHWGAEEHQQEKLYMIEMLQEVAAKQAIRTTFLSGDVHAAAAARLVSIEKVEESKDARMMLQVISSAIGNEPPPKNAISVLNHNASTHKLSKTTKEEPIMLFHRKTLMIKGERNWALVTESDNTHKASLNFQIRLEGMGPVYGDQIRRYQIVAPPLDLPLPEGALKGLPGPPAAAAAAVAAAAAAAGAGASAILSPEEIDVFAKDDTRSESEDNFAVTPGAPSIVVERTRVSSVLAVVRERIGEGDKNVVGASLQAALGPCLRFAAYDPSTLDWSATILVVLTQGFDTKPVLSLYPPKSALVTVPGEKVDEFQGFSFWRFKVNLKATAVCQQIEYSVPCCGDEKFSFFIAASDEKWNWGFHSCNGFEDVEAERHYGGIQPLWKDVLENHTADKPLHVMVGGGDQIYNDSVFEVDLLAEWLKIKHIPDRLAKEFTEEMEENVAWRYFANYVTHWSQDKFRDAMSHVPQVMIWDDHDIFDGWGSYKLEIQECAVFQGMFKWATRFYCLFQQHTTPEKMGVDNKMFGDKGWTWLGQFGSNTAALVLDTRMERSRTQILAPASWEMVKSRLTALPDSVRHVVVVATVPLIYPRVKLLEEFITYMTKSGGYQGSITKLLNASGVGHTFFGMFEEAELMDDLIDHWSANEHEAEKLAFLQMLQEVARTKAIRFSFLSGDVHAAAAGKFSNPNISDPALDHRYMLQITSSAIGNEPPPALAISILNKYAHSHQLDKDTKEEPLKLFCSKSKMIRGGRNWCLVTESDNSDWSSLNFQFRIENFNAGANTGRISVYDIAAPSLDLPRLVSATI